MEDHPANLKATVLIGFACGKFESHSIGKLKSETWFVSYWLYEMVLGLLERP